MPERARENADLPRPRDNRPYGLPKEELPPLFYQKQQDASVSVPVPASPEPEDKEDTVKIFVPKKSNSVNMPEERPSLPPPVQEEEFDYGAYEKYDVPKEERQKSVNHTQKKQTAAKKPVQKNQPSQKKHSKKKKKKNHTHAHSWGGGFLKRLIRHLVILVAVIFLIYSAVAVLIIRKLEKIPEGQRTVTTGSLEESYVRSVLLIGTDSRDIVSERGRSDTMMLLSINSRTHKVYLSSFMRDAYVQIPGHGQNKLNAAYSYGGAELLMDTLEQNYHLSIDDYLCVSFLGFAGIIDSFGGVKISLSDAEAQAVNVILQSEVNELAGDDPLSDFLEKGGTYILNGKQALSYARIRYVGNADFERTSRQREVMTQLFENAKSRIVTAVPELISSAMPHLGTNMTDMELYLLSLRVPFAVTYDIEQMQIPADGTYTPADIDGQSVLQVDFDANIHLLQDTVYSAPAEQ